MEPINGLHRLTELIRKKAAEADGAGRATSSKSNVSGREIHAPRLALEQQLRNKLRKFQGSSSSPVALRRLMIETMLSWEFRLPAHESKFESLVSRVQNHIEEEPDIRNALEKLIKELINQ